MAEREGILAGIAETEIMGIPVGAAVTGALVAGVADGVMSLIPLKAPGVVVRGVAAWVTLQWGPRLFGTKAAQYGGLFLAYDAMQELFDFRGMIRGLFKKGTTAGLGEEEEIELVGEEEEVPELLGGEGTPEKVVLA
jgi:hypothetical protein